MAVQPLGRLPYQLINPSFHRSLMFFCLDVMDVFADFGPNVNISGFFGVACYYSLSLRLNFILTRVAYVKKFNSKWCWPFGRVVRYLTG